MNNMKSYGLLKDTLSNTILTFIVGAILYMVFINMSVLDPFEKAFKDFKFTDIFYAERFNPSKRSDRIVVINIKHANRYDLAVGIKKVSANSPAVIGVDAIFKELKLSYTDSILRQALLDTPNLVLSYYKDGDSLVKNHNYFQGNKQSQGYINLNLEGQNTVVRDFVGYNNELNTFSFASELLLKSGQIDSSYIKDRLSERIPINYIGGNDMFLNFDLTEIIESDNIPALKDAIVLFGYLGDINPDFDIEDKHFTPLNSAWVGRAVPDTFGVIVHANIINMLLNKTMLYKVSDFAIYIISFVLCFLITFFSMKVYVKNNFIFDLSQRPLQLLLSVIILYIALLLLQANIHLNVIPILLLCFLGLEMIDYYVYLITYLNKKFGWQSTLL